MCNCIKEVEEELKSKVSEMDSNLKIENVTDVSLENTAFMIGDAICSTQLFSPARIEYEYKNKKGEIKNKKKKVNISYQFCPFCGEPYKK